MPPISKSPFGNADDGLVPPLNVAGRFPLWISRIANDRDLMAAHHSQITSLVVGCGQNYAPPIPISLRPVVVTDSVSGTSIFLRTPWWRKRC
jgi:hypothetical protein